MASDWFVAWVATGKEQELLPRIRRTEGIQQTIAPEAELWKRRGGVWQKEKQLLFPGYIFVRCDMSSPIYYALRDMPGMIGWLGKDNQWPSVVRQDEMEKVLQISSGTDPSAVLEDVEINLRQRRGYGTLRLKDRECRIPFNVYDDPGSAPDKKQAEAPPDDASPEDEETEQSQG